MTTSESNEISDFLPVNLITGFLGSGKTTLLKSLLQQTSMSDAAVLINEFGDIGLDHHLLERIDENTVLLDSGCVCCSIRGELAEAIKSLQSKVSQGVISKFSRVIIESTGLADPFFILTTLHSDPVLRHHFKIESIITVVDSVNASSQFELYEQSTKQVLVADKLVLTKKNICDENKFFNLVKKLKVLNPFAEILDAEKDVVDAVQLFTSELDSTNKINLLINNPEITQTKEKLFNFSKYDVDDQEIYSEENAKYLGSKPYLFSRHDQGLNAFGITISVPLDWTLFAIWLTMLVHAHGTNILRIKGILNIVDHPLPIAVHGVQHLILPPVHLSFWPTQTRESQIVFILKNISRDLIENSLKMILKIPI